MKTMEWKNIDKAEWERGAWDSEPDKVQWPDEATGLPCLAKRHPSSGHWCGYVGVPEGHPAFGKGYDDVRVKDEDGNDASPDVHGGLTYADKCDLRENEAEGICHVAEPGEPEVWWLGFDCAHSGDVSPANIKRYREWGLGRSSYHETYKPLSYVKNQCAELARQLAA